MNDTISDTVSIKQVPFTCCSFNRILPAMDSVISAGLNEYISITNTESMYHAINLPEHLTYIQKARFSCCDGIGVVLAARLLGHKIPRLHGPDLMLRCCEYGIERGWRHFFYGGKEGVPELLSEKLAKRFPGLLTAGTYSPPFRELTAEEDGEIIRRITETKSDIVWVGLGLLKQEKWIAEHLGRINVPWMIGVGAAFDFHSGTVRRAPDAFRKVGLEWLYRLAFEPRMFIRNLRSFDLLIRLAKEALAGYFIRHTKRSTR